jgi:hypothetical protein
MSPNVQRTAAADVSSTAAPTPRPRPVGPDGPGDEVGIESRWSVKASTMASIAVGRLGRSNAPSTKTIEGDMNRVPQPRVVVDRHRAEIEIGRRASRSRARSGGRPEVALESVGLAAMKAAIIVPCRSRGRPGRFAHLGRLVPELHDGVLDARDGLAWRRGSGTGRAWCPGGGRPGRSGSACSLDASVPDSRRVPPHARTFARFGRMMWGLLPSSTVAAYGVRASTVAVSRVIAPGTIERRRWPVLRWTRSFASRIVPSCMTRRTGAARRWRGDGPSAGPAPRP